MLTDYPRKVDTFTFPYGSTTREEPVDLLRDSEVHVCKSPGLELELDRCRLAQHGCPLLTLPEKLAGQFF